MEKGSLEATQPPNDERSRIVTDADFKAVDFEAPIRSQNVCDMHEFSVAYEHAFCRAREAGDHTGQAVYRLFYDLCSMTIQASDTGSVWVPLITTTTGRSPIAEDYRGEQTSTLATVVDGIVNPGLKARIADIAWSNNRRDGTSAAAAIDAYCDTVVALLDGRMKTCHGQLATHEALPAMRRAIQIANATTRRTKRPEKVGQTFETLYMAAQSQLDISTFVTAVDIAWSFGLRQPNAAVVEIETIAATVPASTYPLAVKRAWDLAARLHHNLNNKDGRQRCLIAAVEQTLAMREQVRGSAAAEAGWIMDALQQLRHVEGLEDRKQALEIELRRLQKASLKQMASMQFDLQIGDTPQNIAKHFETLSLSDAFKQFALLTRSRNPNQLRAKAIEMGNNNPLIAMMPVDHLDDEGRAKSRSAGAPHDGEPEVAWFRRIIGQSEGFFRARIVRAAIEPARMVIQARFGITERHFNAIVGLSAFVPDSQKPILALGFTRFFQGDLMSATHLLIPQLEPCLRHLLKINGHDPFKRRDDSTEEDLSLSNLFFRFRSELSKS